jgi:hypothetical protein
MKSMHRLLVTSRAYRIDSAHSSSGQALDSDNTYYWRMNSRRMEDELVRDSVLYEAGFESILGRPPTIQEMGVCADFLRNQAALLADGKKRTSFGSGPLCTVQPSVDPYLRARENLIHVLLNHNEFVTIR